MGITLDALHQLQSVELQLRAFQQQLAGKERSIKLHAKKLDLLEQDIETRRDDTRRHQMEADELDVDVKARDAQIAKLRAALNTARTNKEYAAILTQINTSKADNVKLEDRMLTLLARADELRAGVEKLQSQRDDEIKRLSQLKDASARLRSQLEPQIDNLRDLRAQAAERVPPQALQTYQRIAQRNEGEAMAHVVQINPRRQEFVCQGCNMAVTLEQVNALITRDKIQQCQICGSILYLEAPAKQKTS